MRLALNAWFWNQPHTGSGQYTRMLVRYLHKLVSDLEISLIFPQVPGEVEAALAPQGVQVVPVPVRAGHLGKVWFEQIAFPRACRELGVDVAHVPYWGSPLQTAVPTVVTVHDITTFLVPEYRRQFKARLYTSLVAAAARGAAHVITDSQASQAEIEKHLGIPATQISAIYLAAGSAYHPAENALIDMAILRKYDMPDFYALYLGGYTWHKNVDTLLLAYTYVAKAMGEDYPLVLAGRKPPANNPHYPDYDRYIKKLGLEDYVKWIGFVDEEDKPVLYRNAETFIFPSRNEGFGLPPLEAMACGTPVVTSNAGSLPEVVGDAGFAVDPDEDRELAGAIIATMVQDNLAAELKQKGLAQAAKFSWEQTATETALLYDRVVNS